MLIQDIERSTSNRLAGVLGERAIECAALSSISSFADSQAFLPILRSIASHPFFGSLRLTKAHPFPSPVILDEINPSGFQCAADSRLNG